MWQGLKWLNFAMLRSTSLRLRLVIAFLLVSVPSMLAATYVAATLISSAFEDNVQQWLGETTRYMLMQIKDNQADAARLAQIYAQEIPKTDFLDQPQTSTFKSSLAPANSMGYDIIWIYDAQKNVVFRTNQSVDIQHLPIESESVLMNVVQVGAGATKTPRIFAGATQAFKKNGKTYVILIGSLIGDTSLGEIKVISSLDLRLYARVDEGFVPVFVSSGDNEAAALSNTMVQRLQANDEVVYDNNQDSDTYRAVYAGLRDSGGKLVGVVFVGLAATESFFPRIGGWALPVGMFALGSLMSVLVGLWMSGLLVRPLRALREGVRSVTLGDYQQRVAVGGGAEVEDLAMSFNSMASQLAKLKQLEADLRRRDRLTALGEAAMVIAHEVRNPLGIIQASAELVRSRAQLAPAENKLLGYVIDEVRRIEALVRDYLDFAHPKPPQTGPVPLREILDRVAALTAPDLAKRNIAFVMKDLAHGLQVEGDSDQIHQAILNLMLNAMDANPTGGTITGTIAATNDCAMLTISDNGVGVAPSAVARLFDPFFTTKTKGSGLGLAKVRTVAEAHGGTAFYHAVDGGGAAFTMTFTQGSPTYEKLQAAQ